MSWVRPAPANMEQSKKIREVKSYPPTAILKTEELAEWLDVSTQTVRALPLPRLKLPSGTVRYSAGAVLAYLEGREA